MKEKYYDAEKLYHNFWHGKIVKIDRPMTWTGLWTEPWIPNKK